MNTDKYFSHNITAHSDVKHEALLSRYKFEGYGVYWYLLEKIGSQPDYKIKLDELLIDSVASKVVGERKKALEIINYMIKPCNLFKKSGAYIYSESLLERMKMKEDIIQKRVKAGQKSGESRRLKQELQQTIGQHLLNKNDQVFNNKRKDNKTESNKTKQNIKAVEEKNKKKEVADAEKEHKFEESQYYDFKIFAAAIKSDPDYLILNGKQINIGYYYERVKVWSKNKTSLDWLDVTKHFILNDFQTNKLVYAKK